MRSPFQGITGICPRHSFSQVMLGQETGIPSERSAAERICKIEQLHSSIAAMHKEVHERIPNRCRKSIEANKAATNIVISNFYVGDLVPVSKAKWQAHKLSFIWCGPRRVVTVKSPAVCVVQDLITQKSKNIHVARLNRYCGTLNGTEVPADVLDLADLTIAKYRVVAEILDIQKHEGKLWLRLRWYRLPVELDFT